MRRILFFLLIAFTLSLFGVQYAKAHRDYTLAIPIASDTHYSQTNDTIFHIMPVVDTFVDTNMYGEVDTVLEVIYPWPSVYDQNSQEGIESYDTGGVFISHMTFDRWAMEDWAMAFMITDLNVAADVDSVDLHLQYQFDNAPAWTVPYSLSTDQDASAFLLTFYPSDLYDNWKLYRYARLRLIFTSDSIAVSSWLVGRQMFYHENVDPGE